MTDADSKIDFITRIVGLYKANELNEFEVTIRDGKTMNINVKLSSGKVVNPADPVNHEHLPPPSLNTLPPDQDGGNQNSSPQDVDGMVYSQMIGTAYLKASPDAELPFVQVGQKVSQGDTILIIEAMKTMNQIEAPYSGTVREIMVADGEPIEYGSELMVIN